MEFHKAKTILTKPPAPYFNQHFFSQKTFSTRKTGFSREHTRSERSAGGMRTFFAVRARALMYLKH